MFLAGAIDHNVIMDAYHSLGISIYEKTVNRKTSRKVSFGSCRGPYKSQLTLDPLKEDQMAQPLKVTE